jgi:bifunctional non-homologous end joining protein LigD
VKSFADRFSRAVSEAEPERFTANIRKAQRTGRIFLDWLRNQRGATGGHAYSAARREGARWRAGHLGRSSTSSTAATHSRSATRTNC